MQMGSVDELCVQGTDHNGWTTNLLSGGSVAMLKMRCSMTHRRRQCCAVVGDMAYLCWDRAAS